MFKGGFKSEEAGKNFRCLNKYSKSLSWAENLNFPHKTVNNLFNFSAQDSDLEYSFWQRKNSSVSSDLKPPQTKSKKKFQADISSKKRMNEFYFTTMKPQIDLFSFVFWRKLKTPKRHFEIKWPFIMIISWVAWQ